MADAKGTNQPESTTNPTGSSLFSDPEIMTNLTQDDEAVLEGGGYSHPGYGGGHYGGKGYGYGEKKKYP